MMLRKPFKKGIRWVVGSGEKISFWYDNWVFQYLICSVCPVVSGSESLVVAQFINQDFQWDGPRLREHVSVEVFKAICSIFIPRYYLEDKLIWGLSVDGCYSVKSGVALLQGAGPEAVSPPKVPFLWIWRLQVPPKIKFFIWKICNNGLPTKKRLEMSHIFVPLECVFCNHPSEDLIHIFGDRPFCVDVFEILGSRFGWPTNPPMPVDISFIDFISVLVKVRSMDEIAKIAIAWWFIWYVRNGISFRNDSFFPSRLSAMIKKNSDRLADEPLVVDPVMPSVSQSNRVFKLPRKNISWIPPLGFCKLNFDGSKLKDGSASLGFIIRDDCGSIKLCGANLIAPTQSILVAEAWALREGIRGARMLGIGKIIIEGDNLSVIQAIKRIWKIPWAIHSLILDAGEDLKNFAEVRVREGNAAADWLTH